MFASKGRRRFVPVELASGAMLVALGLAELHCGNTSTPGAGGGGSAAAGGAGAGTATAGQAAAGASNNGGGGGGNSSGGNGNAGVSGGANTTGGAAGTASVGGTGGGGGAAGGSSAGGSSGAGGGSPTLATCTTEATETPPALKKTPVVRLPGDDQAGEVLGAPGEPGIYVLGHRSGKVYYAVDNKLDPTPMATVAVKNNKGQDEQGLLSIAFHPQFAQNHLFYLLYTAPNANIRIDELERTSVTSSKSTGKVIWDKPRAGGGEFHNGGQIAFNPKDNGKLLLYHSVGNNSSVAQSGMAEGVAGRVLVHDLAGPEGNGSTLGYGLRNPYRMTIDRLTGGMFIGETDDPPGGAVYYSAYDNPVKDYGYRGGNIKDGITGHEGDKAMIGGVVYRGSKIPGACGRYFYSNWPSGVIKSIVVKDGKLQGQAFTHTGLGLANLDSFGEDGEGEMYIATQGGEVYKVEAQ
ncbi:MAG TPA: PQQ-dependent sugar dehydrogenase [Polyangiaceae bacterium]|nr:PQQ-dependent sugar dehydrogenase [Polyangiaceae bacterium]